MWGFSGYHGVETEQKTKACACVCRGASYSGIASLPSVEGKKGKDEKHPFPSLLAEVPKLSLPKYCQWWE